MENPRASKPSVLLALSGNGMLGGADEGPFEAAFALGRKHASRGLVIALVGTLLFHGSLGAYGLTQSYDLTEFARTVRRHMQQSLLASIDIEMQKEPEPPPPELEPEPKAEEPAPAPEKAPPPPTKAEPPPAAAQAGQVLTAKSDPDEPIDLTGTTFVTGNGDSYAGGVTASSGTSKEAVYDRAAAPKGVVGGKGTSPAPAKNLSAPARLATNAWQCAFPEEADIEQINYTSVPVMVSVQADGRAKSVQILKDPGFGFARQARSCALRQAYRPALDSDGKPIAQTLGPINVIFQR